MVLSGNLLMVINTVRILSLELQKRFKRILVIDTLNCLDPHSIIYNRQQLKNIYCVRTPNPYDLIARLGTSESFIAKQKIGAILVNSLSNIFEDTTPYEAEALLKHVLRSLEELAAKHKLVVVVGSSPNDEPGAMKVHQLLKERKAVVI